MAWTRDEVQQLFQRARAARVRARATVEQILNDDLRESDATEAPDDPPVPRTNGRWIARSQA